MTSLLYREPFPFAEGVFQVHRASLHTLNSPNPDNPGLLGKLVLGLFLLGYCTLLPILTTIGVNWIVYFFTADTFFHDSWMMPLLLGFSAFLSGVLIRQRIEDGTGGLARFTLGLLGLVIYAYLTYLDIHQLGGIYSQYMPMFLRPTMVVLIYALPGLGFLGMLFFQHFSLKNYS